MTETAGVALPVRSTVGAPLGELLELATQVRHAIEARGEHLAPGWVEEAAADLQSGALVGWYAPSSPASPSLAFFSRRPARAYGHIHVGPGASGVERAAGLLQRLVEGLPSEVRRLDVGVTGLDEAGERSLAARYVSAPHFTVITRTAMERPIAPEEPRVDLPDPGLRRAPVRAVPLASLQRLDWEAYQRTPDAALFADTPEQNTRVLQEILDGRLGRFLDEASMVVLDTDRRAVGFVLTAEQSSRVGIFLDLAVAPAWRGRGVGRFLLQWGNRALCALGYSSVRLWVTDANTPARALYDGVGFGPTGASAIYRWERAGSGASVAQPQTER